MRTLRAVVVTSLFAFQLIGCGPPSLTQSGTTGPGTSLSAVTTSPSPVENQPVPKNLVVLTPRAAVEVRKLLKATPGARYLRVSVVDGECKLDLDPVATPREDRIEVHEGIQIAVDKKSAEDLPLGTVVDFVDEGGQRGFKVSLAAGQAPDLTTNLADARKGFRTAVTHRGSSGSPPPKPPENVFAVVQYDASIGQLAAYLTPDPKDDQKHPAIIWITGGDCNSIDGGCWREGSAQNDQSASAYRKAGLVMMFPSLRGGNSNPGVKEGFFGEVDDVVAAGDYLAKQPFVDPDRIYLGGHSTGGTLVLLTAEVTDRFRAVFSFGPVADVSDYGLMYNPFRLSDPKELRLRAPGLWLHSVRSPTFIIEGESGGNADSLRSMKKSSQNPLIHFFEVKGANHFNVLAPANRLIADKVFHDSGAKCTLEFTEDEFNRPIMR